MKFVPDFSRNNMIHLNDELHDNSLAIGLEAVFLFECLPVTRCHSHHIAIRACVLLHFCYCLITEYPHLVTLSLFIVYYTTSLEFDSLALLLMFNERMVGKIWQRLSLTLFRNRIINNIKANNQ